MFMLFPEQTGIKNKIAGALKQKLKTSVAPTLARNFLKADPDPDRRKILRIFKKYR
jgi:hypothetical protein